MAVYHSVAPRPQQIITVARFKRRVERLRRGFLQTPLKKIFDAANGDKSWSLYLANYAGAVENRRSKMLFLYADLSSKENTIHIRVKRGFAMMGSQYLLYTIYHLQIEALFDNLL